MTVMSCVSSVKKDDDRPHVQIVVGDKTISALVDTGSACTLISDEVFRKLKNVPQLKTFGAKLSTANGGGLSVKGQAILRMKIGWKDCWRPTIIVEGLRAGCIIGADTMIAEGITVDMKKRTIKLDKKNVESWSELTCVKKQIVKSQEIAKITVKYADNIKDTNVLINGLHPFVEVIDAIYSGKENLMKIYVLNTRPYEVHIEKGDVMGRATQTRTSDMFNIDEVLIKEEKKQQRQSTESSKPTTKEKRKYSISNQINLEELNLKNIPLEHKSSYESLICKYSDVFSVNPNDVGRCGVIKQKITLKDENKVCSTPPYRLPINLMPVAQEYVQKLLDSDIIRPSTSPFSSPLMLVRKPGKVDPTKPLVEQYRVVHDFRRLNAETVRDAYPMVNLFGMIDAVAQGKVFSVLDISSGYWHQELEEESKSKTAFGLPGMGHFEYNRSAQGLCNSGAAFQRLLDHITAGLKGVFVYIDDVVCVSATHAEHLKQLENLFERFRRYGFKCRLSKLQLGAQEVNYLGYNISLKHGIRPGALKTESIRQWLPPKDVTQIKQFLGLCSFFRRTIANFSMIASSLTKLTRQDTDWTGGQLPDDALAAFNELKTKLSSRPCLKAVNFDNEFIVTVDASKKGLGAILSQKFTENGKTLEHPCAYASRTLNPAELKYTAFHLEAMGILWACKHFRPYLVGKHFTIRSDHKPLMALNKTHGYSIDRIYAELEEFLPYTVEYMDGKIMPADGLSRLERAPEVATITRKVGMTHEQLISMQKDDKYIKALVCYLRYGLSSDSANLRQYVRKLSSVVTTREGVLGIDKNKTFLALAPFQLRHTLIELSHDNALAGHFGWEKTLSRLQENWFWPGMRTEVERYCKGCHVCLTVNQAHSKHPVPLRPMPPTTRFNETVFIDLIGPLPPTENKNKYLLVMTDSWSNLTMTAPIHNKEAETVATAFLNTWVTTHSICERCNSDLGSEFVADVFTSLCKKLGIAQKYSSPGHPQSNKVERQNKSIVNYFRKFVHSNPEWEQLLPSAQFAMNTSIHATKKYSPYTLAYGRRPTLVTGLLEPTRTYSENEFDQRYALMTRIMHDVHSKQADAFASQKHQYDKHARQKKFEPGDIVYIQGAHKPNLCKKFQPAYEGPFIVTQTHTNDNYQLQHLKKQRNMHIHANRIKMAPFQEQLYDSATSTSLSLPKPIPKANCRNPLWQRTLQNIQPTAHFPDDEIYEGRQLLRALSPASPTANIPPASPAARALHQTATQARLIQSPRRVVTTHPLNEHRQTRAYTKTRGLHLPEATVPQYPLEYKRGRKNEQSKSSGE